ncbi:MAG: tetratricopeptide repeat protein, partial [Deltaproteobacteria bacterium]|nr:tetratricopeptide repeat protein [Deltaproteobacteria bacterium]
MKAKTIVAIVVLAVAVGVAGFFLGRTKPAAPTAGVKGEGLRPYPSANQPIDYNEVLSELKTRLAEKPDDWELNYRMATAFFEMRRFDDAIVYYKKAILLNPDYIDSYNYLGLASHYVGNTPEGLKYVEEGIRRSPDYQRIWLTKGFLLAYGLGNPKEATAAWEKAISIDPESSV